MTISINKPQEISHSCWFAFSPIFPPAFPGERARVRYAISSQEPPWGQCPFAERYLFPPKKLRRRCRIGHGVTRTPQQPDLLVNYDQSHAGDTLMGGVDGGADGQPPELRLDGENCLLQWLSNQSPYE
jgi:hypothetical protein